MGIVAVGFLVFLLILLIIDHYEAKGNRRWSDIKYWRLDGNDIERED